MKNLNLIFPSNDIYAMLVKSGFSYTLLVETINVEDKAMQQHYIKSLNYKSELVDLTSFQKHDLTIHTSNTIKTAGKFNGGAFIIPKQLISGPIYWYANFILSDTLRILSFSCTPKAPISNFVNLIKKNIILTFENTKLKRKLTSKNEEIEKLLKEASHQSDEPKDSNEKTNTHTHLLLAEDNPANQMLIAQQLELLGYLVDIAEDGKKAYDKWTTGKYNLLLTDCNMPIMDGFELTDAIRETEKRKGGHIPIIAVTANAMQGEDKKCLARGMDDYLSKPIKLKALKEKLNQWTPQKNENKISNTQEQNKKDKVVSKNLSENTVNFTTIGSLIGNDLTVQKSFFKTLLETLPNIISEIISACEAHSIQKINFNLHKLRPSVDASGAEKMLDTITEIEDSLISADWGKTINLAHSLTENFNAIEKSVTSYFKNNPNTGHESSNKQELKLDFYAPSGTNVLIIDDDPFMLDYIKILLLRLEVANISLASQGDIALNMIAENDRPFDIIICDLNMPEMDGVTLLRHLTRLGYAGGIIINSGADSSILNAVSALTTAHNLNLLGSLQKPVTPQKLITLFKLYFEDKKAISLSHAQPNKNNITVSALDNALNMGHIIAYYQPKIDIKNKSVVGFEALARWVDPEIGIILPYLFIPLAEANNLIDKLTLIMFEQVIKQAEKWLIDYPNLKFAINFSMKSLEDLNLPDLLVQTIQPLKLTSKNIIIEVTESGLMENMTATMEVLARLKLQGFALSIDDFGTGYSSMNQLQKLPFSELKLDYSFVHGANSNKKSKAILESSVHLADNLKLSTVAEGVEDIDDWNLVKNLGCDVVQGYFIAKPMPVNDATTWLNQWTLDSHDNL